MKKFQRYLTQWVGIVATFFGALTASMAMAQPVPESTVEFRIDTDVYVDSSRPPLATMQTLFLQDRMVDWDDGRRRLMSIDLRTQQIDLADFASQRRCRLDIGSLASRLRDLKLQLTEEQQQAWASSTEPTEDGDAYVLESVNLRYRFKAVKPFRSEVASAYAEFANLSAQVSAIYPPYNPPLLRLQLNEFLGQKSLLPSEIQRTDLRSKAKDCITARILVQPLLTTQDRERIKDWDVLVQTLKLVTDSEFFQAERSARQRLGTLK